MTARVLVAQIGARRGYAVPAALEGARMLEALYTDLAVNLEPGRSLVTLLGAVRRAEVRRLQGREVPPLVLPKARAFGWPAIRYELDKIRAGRHVERQASALSAFGVRLGKAMERAGFGDATHLYTMLGDVTPMLRAARARGLRTITEIYVLLTGELLVEKERAAYPGLERNVDTRLLDQAFIWLREVVSLTDEFIVPSQTVQDDLVTNFHVDPGRCHLVPYAAADSWYEVHNEPERGRVLFVGTAGIRKGIHILGEAALRLGRSDYAFPVAGGVDESVRTHPVTRLLSFLGRVPRLDVARAYESADVFVLPSLAEGSAEVIYEALAVGLPVVTTAEAGSVVRNGIEGFIVPASDSESLAQRIRELVEDRPLRERMARAAKLRAQDFTWARYSERLVTTINRIREAELIASAPSSG